MKNIWKKQYTTLDKHIKKFIPLIITGIYGSGLNYFTSLIDTKKYKKIKIIHLKFNDAPNPTENEFYKTLSYELGLIKTIETEISNFEAYYKIRNFIEKTNQNYCIFIHQADVLINFSNDFFENLSFFLNNLSKKINFILLGEPSIITSDKIQIKQMSKKILFLNKLKKSEMLVVLDYLSRRYEINIHNHKKQILNL